MSWNRWLAEFTKDMAVRGFRIRSLEAYRGSAVAFAAYLDTHRVVHPHDLTPAVLEAYQAYLYDQPGAHGRRLALRTQAVRLTAVRSFCAFLARRGAVLLDPARELQMPKVVRRLPRGILTRAEVVRFLKAIRTRHPLGLRDRAIFEMLYSTGIRVTELIGLVPQDLDLDSGFLCIRAGKGGRGRVVPLGRVATAWIRRYLEDTKGRRGPSDPLFVSGRGGPMIRGHLSARARAIAKRAGIEKRVTCHSFRHACATHMLQGRASLRHVQELLGHASPGTTQIYTHVAIEDLKRVHQRCHPRNRP